MQELANNKQQVSRSALAVATTSRYGGHYRLNIPPCTLELELAEKGYR